MSYVISRMSASLAVCCSRGALLQVAELIAGLEGIGCTRTTGEDQTVCVISNGFDSGGAASGLQASGDLPEVEIIKVRRTHRWRLLVGSTVLSLGFHPSTRHKYSGKFISVLLDLSGRLRAGYFCVDQRRPSD